MSNDTLSAWIARTLIDDDERGSVQNASVTFEDDLWAGGELLLQAEVVLQYDLVSPYGARSHRRRAWLGMTSRDFWSMVHG